MIDKLVNSLGRVQESISYGDTFVDPVNRKLGLGARGMDFGQVDTLLFIALMLASRGTDFGQMDALLFIAIMLSLTLV